MHISSLITLISSLANVKEYSSRGDANYFHFNAAVQTLNERPSGEHRLSTETQGIWSLSSCEGIKVLKTKLYCEILWLEYKC